MFFQLRTMVLPLLLLCLLLLPGCGGGDDGTAALPESGVTVSGVILSPQRLPIEGISCSLQAVDITADKGAITTTTSAQGLFYFSGVASGRYKLTTVKNGYQKVTSVFVVKSSNLVLNLYMVEENQWNNIYGKDHPMNDVHGIVTVTFLMSEKSKAVSADGIAADLDSNNKKTKDETIDYQDVGYNHPQGTIDWDAQYTYEDGVATFYNVPVSDTYKLTAVKSGYSFGAVTDIAPEAGGIVNYFVEGSKSSTSTIPVKIVNNSTYDDKDVYIVVCGHDSNSRYYYYDFVNNKMTLVTEKPEGGNYYTTLDKIGKEGDRSYNNPTDNLDGGRMYISLGKAADFHVNNNDPKKWATPDYNGGDKFTIVDKVEFCCDSSSKFTTNTTNVDYYSIGFSLKLETNDGTTYTNGFDITENNDVIKLFKDLPDSDIWKQCLIQDTSGNSYRILAPNKFPGEASVNPFKDYLKDTIDDGWTHYKTTTLSASYDKWTYTGTVDESGNLNITCKKGDDIVGTESIPQPSSYVVFACDGYPLANSGDDWSKKLHGLLGSALNRGVFADSDWSTGYYTSDTAKYNYYAKVLHSKGLNNKCYAFAYDDFFHQDTTCDAQFDNIKLVTITLPKMPTPK